MLPGLESAARRMVATVPYRFRLGRTFFEWYGRFEQAESWSHDRVAEYRHVLLIDLLKVLKESHPEYRERLRDVTAEQAAEGLQSIFPVMTRDKFRETLAAPLLARRLSIAGTSGTTGNALQFFHDAEDDQREWAAICHQWRRIGYDPLKSRRAEFRGLVSPGRLIQKFPEYNMLRCSILDLRSDSVRLYAQECLSSGIEFLHGYPSALYLLAQTCIQEGIVFTGIRGVMLASEMVYPHQIAMIEQAFPQAQLLAHYGNAERVALGAWCEHQRTYHMLSLYSLIEVDADGSLIGTNLFNRVNPFIRYRMSDRVTVSETSICVSCHRSSDPLITAVEGRAEDYLFSPVRGWIPPAIVTYPLKGLRVIREIQLYQRVPEVVELRYCADGDGDCREELKQITEGLGCIIAGVTIVPMRHDQLSRGASGKLRWIISELLMGSGLNLL